MLRVRRHGFSAPNSLRRTETGAASAPGGQVLPGARPAGPGTRWRLSWWCEARGDLPELGLAEGFLSGTGEQPQRQAVSIKAEQMRHAISQSTRVRPQPAVAVEHVLYRIVGRVPYVRLRIDSQPGLPPRREDVLGVQVGAQHHGVRRGG